MGSNLSQVRQKYQEDIFEVAKGEPNGPRATMARANPVSPRNQFLNVCTDQRVTNYTDHRGNTSEPNKFSTLLLKMFEEPGSDPGIKLSQVRQKYQEDIFEVAKGEPNGPRATTARANPVSPTKK